MSEDDFDTSGKPDRPPMRKMKLVDRMIIHGSHEGFSKKAPAKPSNKKRTAEKAKPKKEK